MLVLADPADKEEKKANKRRPFFIVNVSFCWLLSVCYALAWRLLRHGVLEAEKFPQWLMVIIVFSWVVKAVTTIEIGEVRHGLEG